MGTANRKLNERVGIAWLNSMLKLQVEALRYASAMLINVVTVELQRLAVRALTRNRLLLPHIESLCWIRVENGHLVGVVKDSRS